MRNFPAEWYRQSAVQLTWPDDTTDWNDNLEEAVEVYVNIVCELTESQKVVIVCQNASKVEAAIGKIDNVLLVECGINDTWARDHGGISVFENGQPVVLDFAFNAWGGKFAFDKDNDITKNMLCHNIFNDGVKYEDHLDLILEGGSVESDGKGTILTTSTCLLTPERNPHLSKSDIEDELKNRLGAERILWIQNGYMAGDDTDSHIDTLARFVDEDTIAYVSCDDEHDEHYSSLKAMEAELKSFSKVDGTPYRLVELPMADAVYEDNHRLPATYANFLIANDKILVPFYGSPKDDIVKALFEEMYKGYKVVGINCVPLIKQHGSLHCITMQYPEGFIK